MGTGGKHAGLGTEPHCAAFAVDGFLAFEEADDGVASIGGEFGAVGVGESEDIAGEFDDGALHSEADAEEGDLMFAGELDGLDFAFDTAHTEAAGNENAVDAFEVHFGALAFEVFGFESFDDDLCGVGEAGVIEGFVDGFVGVAMFDVFADDGDGDLVFWVADAVNELAVVFHLQGAAFELQFLTDEFIEAMFNESDGDFVDGEFLVDFFDDGAFFNVAEEGDFIGVFAADGAFGADDEDIRLNADFAELLHAVLGGFGFGFACGFEVWHECKVDEHAVFAADIERYLADGLEEGQTFDVADGATKFGDDNVDIGGGETEDAGFDFVGDVGDDLDCSSEIFATAFFFDDGRVDLTGGVVGVSVEVTGCEAFVVAEIEIGFGAVVEYIHLAVLIGAHGTRVNVEVGVQFLHADFEPAAFQQHANGGGGESFAKRADDSSGDKYMAAHVPSVQKDRQIGKGCDGGA